MTERVAARTSAPDPVDQCALQRACSWAQSGQARSLQTVHVDAQSTTGAGLRRRSIAPQEMKP